MSNKKIFGRNVDDWVDEYALSHQNGVNQICHTIGIPAIVIGLLLMPLGFIWLWCLYAGGILFVSGWIFQLSDMHSKANRLNSLKTGGSFSSAFGGGLEKSKSNQTAMPTPNTFLVINSNTSRPAISFLYFLNCRWLASPPVIKYPIKSFDFLSVQFI